jgi:rare lipoprotein A
MRTLLLAAALMALNALTPASARADGEPTDQIDRPAAEHAAPKQHRRHHPGGKQVGKASFYAHHFKGRKMANGEPMQPDSNNAASKTLPLGSTARVTNLENGNSAVVKITDRGPHVPGRIVDLSPSTASELGMKKDGVVQVEVQPLHTPGGSATK